MAAEQQGEWVGERDSKSAMQQAAVAVGVAVAVAVAAAEHARVKPSYLCRNNRKLVN